MSTTAPSTKKNRTTPAKPRARPAPPSKPPLVRGEVIVQRVHEATLRELAEVGYRALRIDDVASRAEVNKTTVYRRWPTKAELVRDALTASHQSKFALIATGTLRSDLLALARGFVEHVSAPVGQSLVRMLMAEAFDPEIIELVKTMRRNSEALPRTLIANAVARGELSPETDHLVMVDALLGALHHRIFFMHEEADEAFQAGLIELLLRGALSPAARRRVRRKATT